MNTQEVLRQRGLPPGIAEALEAPEVDRQLVGLLCPVDVKTNQEELAKARVITAEQAKAAI